MKVTPAKIMLIGTFIVIALWGGYSMTNLGRPMEKWGVFGDKFGALNTLFTGLGFVGLLATLYHQHREVENAKEDLAKVIRALSATAEALHEQANLIKAQMRQQRIIEETNAFERDQSIVKALQTELRVVWEIYSALTADDIEGLNGKVPLRCEYPQTPDYFPIYRGNGNLIGRLDDNALRSDIVSVYTLGTALMSMLEYNNKMAFDERPEMLPQRIEYANKIKNVHGRLKKTYPNLERLFASWFDRHQSPTVVLEK